MCALPILVSVCIRSTLHRGPISQMIWELIIESGENSPCFDHASNDPVKSQICTWHNSWAVGLCAKLWSDWIIIHKIKILQKCLQNFSCEIINHIFFMQVQKCKFLQDLDYELINLLWNTRLILGLRPANERRRYKVTPSPIGWAQTWNQPCNRL